ncbi:element excision factor XisH family protein [Calothrix sp. CCY 0018]|uniref:element excision factor XisH family protein n=1 Tax=Calothrix sp. CCY 0018 TaxID=3103864 RepID=UPI0039C6BE47
MPAKDIYHDTVITVLKKEGWVITDDPLKLKWGLRELFVDLGASKLLAAQKGEQKIAVEIKSFVKISPVRDLEEALGQYILYRNILEETEPSRQIYLGIRNLVIQKKSLRLLVFDSEKEVIVQWIN